MGRFSATEAAFAGFRFVRENPKTVAVWAVVYLAFAIVSNALMAPTLWPVMAELQAAANETLSPEESFALLRRMAPGYGVMILVCLVFYPVLYALMNRAALRPDDSAYAYLRVGGDEVRQLLLFLLYFVVGLGAYIAVIIVGVVLGVGLGLLFGAAGGKTAAGLIALVLFLVIFAGAIYAWTRLSLASALTFDSGKVDLFGSWRLTRGQFWPMFGTYMLVLALTVVTALLVLIIVVAAAAAVGGMEGLRELMQPDFKSMAAFFSPVRLVVMVVSSMAAALLMPVWLMPRAAIYAQLRS
jgi:hypothetical protein